MPRGFAEVGYTEAIARARALVPLLREHAAACEKATKLTPAVLEALHASGLFRFMQPKRWGGMELGFDAYFDVPHILGQGDASIAWTWSNLASHHRQLVLWHPRAQEEIWGENPDALIASGIAYAQGRGVRVDGGIRLSGEWGFSSGVDPSTWNMLACVIREDDKPVDWAMCVVPAADYEIIDDWDTLGMRGTGSRSVRADDVFVPAHRVCSMQVARAGHAFPGLHLHPNPVFRVPTAALGGHHLAAVMTGNAQAALDESMRMVKQRSTAYTHAKMRDLQTVQLRLGSAAARIEMARDLLRADCLASAATIAAGGALELETKLRLKRNAAVAMKIAHEALDSLHEMAGGGGIYEQRPLARMFRDAHAAAGHFSFSIDAQVTPWALVALGGAFASPTL